MCLWGVSQSNSDRALLVQIDQRQLTLLPSEMLICAGRKVLVVAVEMVNYYGILKKELNRPGTADEAHHGYQQRYKSRLHDSLSH